MQDYWSYMFPELDWCDKLDDIALTKACVIGTASLEEIQRSPVGPRFDWRFTWIKASETWKEKKLLLLATNDRTAELVKAGQIRFFKQHGIPEDYAELLHRTSGYRKHEMAPVLGEILQNNDLLEATLAYGGFGKQGVRRPWLRDRIIPLVGEDHAIVTMTPTRCDDLMKLVRFLTNELIKDLVSTPNNSKTE